MPLDDKRDEGAGQIISKPHNHDVLCGRGGFTNQHTGNEWFRRLVRSNRALYRSCPKHTKLLVAKAIVQAVQQQDPPGRFLEVADKNAGTWVQITYKRAVDKTSQALREKEQPHMKDPNSDYASEAAAEEAAQVAAQAAAKKGKVKGADLADLTKATLKQAGLDEKSPNYRKRKPSIQIIQTPPVPGSSWWNAGGLTGNSSNEINKRMRTDMDDLTPLPPGPLETSQSSLFSFLNGAGLFGRSNNRLSIQQQQQQQQLRNSFSQQQARSSFGQQQRGSFGGMFSFSRQQQNPGDLITAEAAAFEDSTMRLSFAMNNPQPQQPQLSFGDSLALDDTFDPLPVSIHANNTNRRCQVAMAQTFQQEQIHQQQQHQQHQQQYGAMLGRNSMNQPHGSNRDNYPVGVYPQPGMDTTNAQQGGMYSSMGRHRSEKNGDAQDDAPIPPPMNRLTTQVSDWLTSFFPLTGKEAPPEEDEGTNNPPPLPPQNLERGISSTIFNLARSPSQFLTNLKSGVSSMFGANSEELTASSPPAAASAHSRFPSPPPMGNTNAPAAAAAPLVLGTASSGQDLLDDYEETPLESRLRSVIS